MRHAFIQSLEEIAARDPRVVLLTADLGYGVLERFATRLPAQFINVGVAEQNMIGIATGLAEGGYLPFAYSIASFASLRAYEFIRNGPILQRLPVRIVGIGGGTDYAHQGLTHYALEDLAVMRAQPSLTVIAPADGHQARAALAATWDSPRPVYYRLGKDELPPLAGLDGRFDAAGVETVMAGKDLVFVAVGPAAYDTLAAATALAGQHISCAVVVVACLNPPPVAALAGVLSRFQLAITVESHYLTGGLGSLVCEVVATEGLRCRVERVGVTETPASGTGSAEFMKHRHGLTGDQLRDTALRAFGRLQAGNARPNRD